jgi:hypothetical protein
MGRNGIEADADFTRKSGPVGGLVLVVWPLKISDPHIGFDPTTLQGAVNARNVLLDPIDPAGLVIDLVGFLGPAGHRDEEKINAGRERRNDRRQIAFWRQGEIGRNPAIEVRVLLHHTNVLVEVFEQEGFDPVNQTNVRIAFSARLRDDFAEMVKR